MYEMLKSFFNLFRFVSTKKLALKLSQAGIYDNISWTCKVFHDSPFLILETILQINKQRIQTLNDLNVKVITGFTPRKFWRKWQFAIFSVIKN